MPIILWIIYGIVMIGVAIKIVLDEILSDRPLAASICGGVIAFVIIGFVWYLLFIGGWWVFRQLILAAS